MLKEWGREESAELQWCYPSLLNTCSQEDFEGERVEAGLVNTDEERREGKDGRKGGKMGVVSIIRSPLEQTVIKSSVTLQSEDMPPRRKVTLMGLESPLSLSPSKKPVKHFLDPNQKPIRTSGLDCGDIDPFVQSDSFVYLAVSARPGSKGEVPTVTEVSTQHVKQDSIQHHTDSMKMNMELPNPETDTKVTHLVPQKPEEGDFLCTDSFVYLAAPACLLLGPPGTTPYSGK